ncbi:hypothetical protein BG015_008484, partial [Linnemannia schmuckeri]
MIHKSTTSLVLALLALTILVLVRAAPIPITINIDSLAVVAVAAPDYSTNDYPSDYNADLTLDYKPTYDDFTGIVDFI